MSTGLLALLDDVAALVKLSAASLDDISAQVAKTGSKVSGVVIDDAAVTPKYVVGLDPKRELAIIGHIGAKSLLNKLVFLAPSALILGYFLPWIIQPILMCGGAYLCFEGYEKVLSILYHAKHDEEKSEETPEVITPEELEKMRITSAVRTDFILSAEIIAITYATVAAKSLFIQIMVLLSVAIGITIAVYGFVGLVVKADDIGVHLAKKSKYAFLQKVGRGIVKIMPPFLVVLGYIGTAAMLWVGAEIIAHGIPPIHHLMEELSHKMIDAPFIGWLIKVTLCASSGIAIGYVIALLVGVITKLKIKLFK